VTASGRARVDDLLLLDVASLGNAYHRGDTDPVAVTAAHLERIEQVQPQLNSFRLVDADAARLAAAASARRWAAGEPRSPLDGVPVTIKDIVAVAGWPTTSGSAASDHSPAAVDAPPVARLREAGAVLLGMTTTPEFGWKGMTDSPLCGITRNPWDLTRTPGGSSGGAGASLAAGVATIAFGTDGGGSIRIPASYCGLVGLKPSAGRVPQHPDDGLFSSMVSGGPLARSVIDAATVLNELVRPDARDPWSLPADGRDWRAGVEDGVRGLRCAVTVSLGGAAVRDAEIAAAVAATAGRLADLGAQVTEVGTVFDSLRPRFEDHWKAGFAKLLRDLPEEQHGLLDPGLRRLAEEGMAVGIGALYDAQAARTTLAATMRELHDSHDVLVTPTMPTVAPPVTTVYHSPGFDRWDDAVPFTLPFNLTGQPAASVPVAVSASGLPIGVQVVASHHREDLVLRAARAIETVSDFAQPHPLLVAAMETWLDAGP
jgi:aspartyl-tRNA(Asn)/glutamyl-tRNA(Gln) amidotransferase subunit A